MTLVKTLRISLLYIADEYEISLRYPMSLMQIREMFWQLTGIRIGIKEKEDIAYACIAYTPLKTRSLIDKLNKDNRVDFAARLVDGHPEQDVDIDLREEDETSTLGI